MNVKLRDYPFKPFQKVRIQERPITTPNQIEDLVLWIDGADSTTLFTDGAGTTPVTADGNAVGRWADKSGSGNHLIQDTVARKGTYHTNGTPSGSYVTFGADGLNGIQDFAYPTGIYWTIIGVVKIQTAGGIIFSYGESAASGSFRLASSANASNNLSVFPTLSESLTHSALTIMTEKTILIGVWSVDGTKELRASGVHIGGPTNTTATGGSYQPTGSNDRFALASIASGTSSSAQGDYYEMMCFARALTEPEIAYASGYLRAKWGVIQ